MADRDKRRPHTPPAGVAAQLAPESWEEGHTGTTPVDPLVPEIETPTETLLRRTAQTKNTTLDLTARVDSLHGRVERIEQKLEDHGRQNATIIGMTGDVISMLKQHVTVTTTTQLAEVKVTTERALTENEIRKEEGLAEIAEKRLDTEVKAEARKKAIKVTAAIALALLGLATAYLKLRGCV